MTSFDPSTNEAQRLSFFNVGQSRRRRGGGWGSRNSNTRESHRRTTPAPALPSSVSGTRTEPSFPLGTEDNSRTGRYQHFRKMAAAPGSRSERSASRRGEAEEAICFFFFFLRKRWIDRIKQRKSLKTLNTEKARALNPRGRRQRWAEAKLAKPGRHHHGSGRAGSAFLALL